MKLKALIVVFAILIMAISVSAGIFDFITGSTVTATVPACIDSDGDDTNIAGRVTLTETSEVYEDKCIDDTTLLEYNCVDDELEKKIVSCPLGFACKYGKCAKPIEPPAVTCTDTDGGKNYFAKGMTNIGLEEKEDSCSGPTGTPLIEQFCSLEGEFEYELVACPEGYRCIDGACVKKGAGEEEPEDEIKALEERIEQLEKKIRELEKRIEDCCEKEPSIIKQAGTIAAALKDSEVELEQYPRSATVPEEEPGIEQAPQEAEAGLRSPSRLKNILKVIFGKS